MLETKKTILLNYNMYMPAAWYEYLFKIIIISFYCFTGPH